MNVGSYNMDNEFLKQYHKISTIENKKDEIKFYLEWLKKFGEVPKCQECNNVNIPDSLLKNLDFKWLNDSQVFNKKLIKRLNYLVANRNTGSKFYVSQDESIGNPIFTNENKYQDSIFPSDGLRLLSLARYWNCVNYFYPYKYKIPENWDSVLVEMIPRFLNANNTIDYHLSILELTVKVEDSHASFTTPLLDNYFGQKWLPFKFKIINEKAIVVDLVDDSLCLINDIKIGDILLNIDGIELNELIDSKLKYVSGSNLNVKMRDMQFYLLNGNSDSIYVQYDREGQLAYKYIYRYTNKEIKKKNVLKESSFLINDKVALIDMGLLTQDEVKPTMEKYHNCEAIIFDLRNYPKGTMYSIISYLNSTVKPFSIISYPDLTFPGLFAYTKPLYCGKQNSDNFKGLIVLLVDEKTQSHAEFTAMCLQSFSKCIVVGSQTAGADGNVSEIYFPGGFSTFITGIGVYYPNGKETQQIGIIPDFYVNTTIEGIRLKKDEILEEALRIIKK
jgi:C-terminal processing protease CtpA/Prc